MCKEMNKNFEYHLENKLLMSNRVKQGSKTKNLSQDNLPKVKMSASKTHKPKTFRNSIITSTAHKKCLYKSLKNDDDLFLTKMLSNDEFKIDNEPNKASQEDNIRLTSKAKLPTIRFVKGKAIIYFRPSGASGRKKKFFSCR